MTPPAPLLFGFRVMSSHGIVLRSQNTRTKIFRDERGGSVSKPTAVLGQVRLRRLVSPLAITRAAWIVVVVATVMRLVVAARLPLSGDEAYYWEWSRRLAFGYVDHPPMVAWLIALSALGAKNAFLIRLPFVLCGLGAAIAISAFATRAAGDERAGAVAALLLSLAPFATIAFTMAAPDGPELFFWSLSLYLGLRALDASAPRWRVPLALSVAGAVLSSVLAAFLAVGIAYALVLSTTPAIVRRLHVRPDQNALVAALLFAAAICPYLIWDASHGWPALHFAVLGRHTLVPEGNFLTLAGVTVAVLTPGIFLAAFPAGGSLLRGSSLVERLLLATSIPLLAVCFFLSLLEKVEFNWLDGAFVSLLGALGFYAPRMFNRFRFLFVAAPAIVLTAILFLVAITPIGTLRFIGQNLGIHLRNQGAFEIWAFEPAALDVAKEAAASGAMVMTDGYGLSSALDFYAGIPPVVIGYDRQGQEARGWLGGRMPPEAIFFDKEPLVSRPDFQQQLARACAVVKDDGTRTYFIEGQVTRTFYLTRCEGLTPAGFSLLLFKNKR